MDQQDHPNSALTPALLPLPHPLLLAAFVQRGIIKTMGMQAKLTQKASMSCGERPNKEALSSSYWLNQS
ncbi:hypothetical protein ACRRTK_017607 [Alexandromys fortis]